MLDYDAIIALYLFYSDLGSIENDYCEDIEDPDVCQSKGICEIKHYCSKCPETCGQCRKKRDVCSGKLKDCRIQPLCDDLCFDRRNETFCNQVKLTDGCNRSDDGEKSYILKINKGSFNNYVEQTRGLGGSVESPQWVM